MGQTTVLLNQELSDKWIIWSWSGTTILTMWNPSETEPEHETTCYDEGVKALGHLA